MISWFVLAVGKVATCSLEVVGVRLVFILGLGAALVCTCGLLVGGQGGCRILEEDLVLGFLLLRGLCDAYSCS